jgi:hypothetical protein
MPRRLESDQLVRSGNRVAREQSRQLDRSKRFGLSDAMAFTMATALGLGLARTVVPELASQSFKELFSSTDQAILVALALAVPCIACWTLALVGICLLRSGPPRWRRMRQPGLVAGVAVILSVTLGAIPWVMLLLNGAGGIDVEDLVLLAPLQIGPAIMTAWSIQLLSRRWRPERSWIDQLGRALALTWLPLAALCGWLILL